MRIWVAWYKGSAMQCRLEFIGVLYQYLTSELTLQPRTQYIVHIPTYGGACYPCPHMCDIRRRNIIYFFMRIRGRPRDEAMYMIYKLVTYIHVPHRHILCVLLCLVVILVLHSICTFSSRMVPPLPSPPLPSPPLPSPPLPSPPCQN